MNCGGDRWLQRSLCGHRCRPLGVATEWRSLLLVSTCRRPSGSINFSKAAVDGSSSWYHTSSSELLPLLIHTSFLKAYVWISVRFYLKMLPTLLPGLSGFLFFILSLFLDLIRRSVFKKRSP